MNPSKAFCPCHTTTSPIIAAIIIIIDMFTGNSGVVAVGVDVVVAPLLLILQLLHQTLHSLQILL